MQFEPKALAPSGSGPEASHSAFEVAASGGVTVLEAPSGLMHTEGLSSAFTRMGRKPHWLRLGPEDRDPEPFSNMPDAAGLALWAQGRLAQQMSWHFLPARVASLRGARDGSGRRYANAT